MTEEGSESVIRRDRFSGGPARSFLSSMAFDQRIFAADIAIDRAHVVMLAEQGIIAEGEAGEILEALDSVVAEGFEALPDAEDVHEAIETAVIDEIGPVGGKMHTARSRNDEIATCLRYQLREDLLDGISAILTLREGLVVTASEELTTTMPGYTHLQPAQPTTVAHWALSYESALARDTARLLNAYERVNRSPLGAAAFAGTPFPIDRDRTAALLGFAEPMENAMDASSARDFLVEPVAGFAMTATTLSGLAADIIIFANRGYVELADDYASTSSIMPQKKNPDTLELVRATSGNAAAGLNGLLTTLKGLPRAYNRDLQRATPHAWEALEAVVEAVDVTAGAVSTAEWQSEALGEASWEGFATATGVADLLAMHGIPFRTAHEILATVAERAEEASGGPIQEQANAWDDEPFYLDPERARIAIDHAAQEVLGTTTAAYVDPDELEAMLDPENSVASRDSFGGPAPDVVREAIGRADAHIDRHASAVTDATQSLADSADLLQTEVSRYG